MCILLALLLGSGSNSDSGSKRDKKITERERRWREEEYDEIDGIEDADY